MNRLPRLLCLLFAVLLTAACGILLSSLAWASDYADGTYTVPFSMEGLGRHNVAWSTATVHVEDGALYVEPLTSVSDLTEYKAAESETEIAEGTIASYIGQSIIKEKQDEAKGKFKKDFYKDELEDDKVTSITYYEKVYQDLIDAYKD